MTTEFYLRELRWAHRSEQFGLALYRAAAWATRDARRKRIWRVLAQLEAQTQARLADALLDAREPPRRHWLATCFGTLSGLVGALLPWHLSLHSLGQGAQPFLERLERLREKAADYNPALLDYLVAHERAQLELVEHELAGRTEQSLAAALALLDSPPRSA